MKNNQYSINTIGAVRIELLLAREHEQYTKQGNRNPQNSRREFPEISEILPGITGNFASFVFFSNRYF